LHHPLTLHQPFVTDSFVRVLPRRCICTLAQLARRLAAATATATIATRAFAADMSAPLPALFVSHGGGPCFYMEASGPDDFIAEIDSKSRAADFFRNLLPSLALPQPPKALLVVSAHWEEKQVTLMTGRSPPLLFDYGGFPDHTYKLTWPAPGPPPALVERVQGLLAGAGVPTRVDASRGFDHGVFVPLKLSFPRADVPVLQLSLHASLDPALHARVGAALAPLRREGVLIVGSGFLTHNMRAARGPGPPVAWAKDFEAAVDAALGLRGGESPGGPGGEVDWRAERLAALSTGPLKALFRQAHPREEHFTPILVAAAAGLAPLGAAPAEVGADGSAAAAAPAGRVKKIYEQTVMGSFVLTSYRFDSD
jgi:hypothetical protein